MGRLNGQRAWITGGGTGTGAGAARALAASGAEIILSGRRTDALQQMVESIEAEGGVARAEPLDVSDATAVAEVAARIGTVNILVANAGLNVPDRGLDVLQVEGWQKVVNVNLNGTFHPVHAVLPGMRAAGSGLIILISSWAGRYVGTLTGAAYNATKRAVLALNETINLEEGGNGIRATAILPGEVATDILKSRPKPPSQADISRMLQIEDLAETVRFVAEMPPHVCLNEIVISPTWNRFYRGFNEIDAS
ncbi:SDR family oxidoreductase [Sedimentitalea arenosa]|uniref:SDR family NAD(P)-dependent oxidoreductase n=1 Tax=Sedimentitalea arenosa TaxID=2798803 RepID=A0A8J7J8W9_9RHOB|nr:SDR family NAD(P)-dependent oxidoreductase [Arenibacterium arenosum]MBJ6371108.1 SDR family NAD(P)-dependent oxidoreductase [Arenibacterium arenosum]